jgi:predicted dehydrogenase
LVGGRRALICDRDSIAFRLSETAQIFRRFFIVAMASKTFRLGLIGAGGISHMHATHALKVEGVEIAAAADVSAASLDKFTAAFPGTKTYDDYKTMLAKESLDAVSVCTPNGLHAQNTIDALGAGVDVLVEKPMAMNAKEGQSMIDAARKAKKELVVGFQFRFDPRTQLIRKHIDEGHFGKILYVRCQALRRRGIPNWGVFGRKDLQGGGPMIDIGVHVMEMAHFAIGAPKPLTATGNVWTYYGNKPTDTLIPWPGWDHKTYTVEDLAVGMIRCDGGTMINIEASFVAHIENDVWSFQVMGEKGGATWDPTVVFTDQVGHMFNMTPGYISKGGWDVVWERKMKHFIAVCRGETKNLSTGEDGLAVQKMLDGVYASAAEKREVGIE